MGQMSFWRYEKVPNERTNSMWQNCDLVMKLNLSHEKNGKHRVNES
jgi:hypothetical protein